MAVAVQGVTTSFVLPAATTTQLSNANNGRTYLLITNDDQVNSLRVAFGTGTEANATTGHILPPSAPNVTSYMEIIGPAVPKGAVSAWPVAGTPQISYTEA